MTESAPSTTSPKIKEKTEKSAFLAQTDELPQFLTFHIKQTSSHLFKITIKASNKLVRKIYDQTVELFRTSTFEGFSKNNAPFEYVEESYQNEINYKIKNHILHHWIIDFLFDEIRNHKIPLSNDPRLSSIEKLPDKSINYYFDLSVSDPLELKEWKNFAFRTPKRKRYKDLDKQVTTFIEINRAQAKKCNLFTVEEYDWVFLEAGLVGNKQTPIIPNSKSYFWLLVDKQEVTTPLTQELLGKSLNNSFLTTHFDRYQQSHEHKDDYNYQLHITIEAILKGTYFSIDTFKSTFKLKNKTEVHNKLMEIFSYRNDISQRKSIIGEVFHLLLSKHRFEVPKHLILRREENIVQKLSKQPDYHVYKSQKNFNTYLEMLAEKQLKEEILIDHITYHENLKAEIKDFEQYLHLFNNKKLNEFIYFKPSWEIQNPSVPINAMLFAQTITREKTLNHIIHLLTR